MKLFCKQDFQNCPDFSYPDGWRVEKNCSNENLLAEVRNGAFHLLFPGNRHLPITPELTEFESEITLVSGNIFPVAALRIFFCYHPDTQTGLLLNCRWGTLEHNPLRPSRGEPPPERIVTLSRYDGKNQNRHCTVLDESRSNAPLHTPGIPLVLRLNVARGRIVLFFDGIIAADFSLPKREKGFLAFDREPEVWKDSLRLTSFRLSITDESPEETLFPEHSFEFPSGINGIISPIRYHASVVKRCGIPVLKAYLSGGAESNAPWPEIERFRLGELLTSPYFRIERQDGSQLGRFLIRRGTVGLTSERWNELCTVFPPARYGFPAAAEFILPEWPENCRFIAGYERYDAEDSLGVAGGPTEAVLDSGWRVLYAGATDDPAVELRSEPDKKLMAQIPSDIQRRPEAESFLRSNFFYLPGEEIRIFFRLLTKRNDICAGELLAEAQLEDVFGHPVNIGFQPILSENPFAPERAAGFRVFEALIRLPHLSAGVYHIQAMVDFAGKKSEVRRALEIITGDSVCPAPRASGLPALFCNIISGIHSGHFNPWSPAVDDTVHYHSGGTLFFKKAAEYQAPRLLKVYDRPFLCWLKYDCFNPGGIAENIELVRDADYVAHSRYRTDCWSIPHYNSPRMRQTLLNFLKSDCFRPFPNGALSAENVSSDPEVPLSEAQFRELTGRCMDDWLQWCDRESDGVALHFSKALREAGARGIYSFCSAVYPTYGSVYKSDHFLRFCGLDPRRGSPIELYSSGPNGVEDYPWSSKYEIARGVFQMAAFKLAFPDSPLNPECFGINGESADRHVVFANPPYGVSSPPPGFLEKLFYNYSYGVCYFRDGKFHYWNDHGYHIRGWQKYHYADMFKAYDFIRSHPPVRPIGPTTAFVLSLDSCAAHPEYYEKDPELFLGGYLSNTAEEFVPFVYEQFRKSGGTGGFLTRMEDISGLDASCVSQLVLPPLDGVPEKFQQEIRRLHREGVALFSAETPGRLEDLFGVVRLPHPERIGKIFPTDLLPDLAGLKEESDHPLSEIFFGSPENKILLRSGNGFPVLSACFRAKKAPCVFFHLPPTAIRRAKDLIPSYGQPSISVLLNRATGEVCRTLNGSAAETSAGNLLSFEDKHGMNCFIVSEDVWPERGETIYPIVTFRAKDISPSAFATSGPYRILSAEKDCIRLRLKLAEHQSMWLIQQKTASLPKT